MHRDFLVSIHLQHNATHHSTRYVTSWCFLHEGQVAEVARLWCVGTEKNGQKKGARLVCVTARLCIRHYVSDAKEQLGTTVPQSCEHEPLTLGPPIV